MSAAPRWFGRRFAFDLTPDLHPNVRARLAGAPARLDEALAAVPPPRRTGRPDGSWSALEHAGHLGDLEPLWHRRTDQLLAGAAVLEAADLENRATEAAGHDRRPVSTILTTFRTARMGWLAKLDGQPAEAFARASRHPRLDQPMRLIDLMPFVAEHDDHHLARLREMAAGG